MVWNGYDLTLIKLITNDVKCPIVISGGDGKSEDFTKAAKFSCISGLSASSVFHFNKLEILDLKKELKENNVEIVE